MKKLEHTNKNLIDKINQAAAENVLTENLTIRIEQANRLFMAKKASKAALSCLLEDIQTYISAAEKPAEMTVGQLVKALKRAKREIFPAVIETPVGKFEKLEAISSFADVKSYLDGGNELFSAMHWTATNREKYYRQDHSLPTDCPLPEFVRDVDLRQVVGVSIRLIERVTIISLYTEQPAYLDAENISAGKLNNQAIAWYRMV